MLSHAVHSVSQHCVHNVKSVDLSIFMLLCLWSVLQVTLILFSIVSSVTAIMQFRQAVMVAFYLQWFWQCHENRKQCMRLFMLCSCNFCIVINGAFNYDIYTQFFNHPDTNNSLPKAVIIKTILLPCIHCFRQLIDCLCVSLPTRLLLLLITYFHFVAYFFLSYLFFFYLFL